MLQVERLRLILDYLNSHPYATVKELSKSVFMSETVVRRDLTYLENHNIVKRNYGGVMLVSHMQQVVPYNIRSFDHVEEKKKIAERALGHIHHGDTVFLDSSSTAGTLAMYFTPEMNLTVFTCSNTALKILCEKNITVYSTGGLYDPLTDAFGGYLAEQTISGLHANVCFFSATALSREGVISNSGETFAHLKQLIIAHSDKSVFLCDHHKFDTASSFAICNLKDVDYAVTDTAFPEHLKNMLK